MWRSYPNARFSAPEFRVVLRTAARALVTLVGAIEEGVGNTVGKELGQRDSELRVAEEALREAISCAVAAESHVGAPEAVPWSTLARFWLDMAEALMGGKYPPGAEDLIHQGLEDIKKASGREEVETSKS